MHGRFSASVNGRPGINYVQKLSMYAEILRTGSPRDILFSGITSIYRELNVLCIAKCQHALLIAISLCIQRLCESSTAGNQNDFAIRRPDRRTLARLLWYFLNSLNSAHLITAGIAELPE